MLRVHSKKEKFLTCVQTRINSLLRPTSTNSICCINDPYRSCWIDFVVCLRHGDSVPAAADNDEIDYFHIRHCTESRFVLEQSQPPLSSEDEILSEICP